MYPYAADTPNIDIGIFSAATQVHAYYVYDSLSLQVIAHPDFRIQSLFLQLPACYWQYVRGTTLALPDRSRLASNFIHGYRRIQLVHVNVRIPISNSNLYVSMNTYTTYAIL
jgi:hypothetical protein